VKVGLALREQVLAAGDVPVGTNDVQVDMIVTPDETITLHGAHAPLIDSHPKSE
jgi:5-formyltetrahydrofolate cyclo-ligase